MKNKDVLAMEKAKIVEKMNQAIKNDDANAFSEAFLDLCQKIEDNVIEQAKEMMAEQDATILAQRGVRQLTSKEKKYYEKIIEAMRSADPKQALNDVEVVMPETIIDSVFDELQTNHPLLSKLNATTVTGLTRMMMNTNGEQKAAWYTIRKTVTYSKSGTRTFYLGVTGQSGQQIYLTDIRVLRDVKELVDDVDAKIAVEVGKVSASVSEVYENVQHDYCTNPTFSIGDDKFDGWTRNSTAAVTQTTYGGKSCAQIVNTSSLFGVSWKQDAFSKAGKIRVRFKAACASGNENTARLRVRIDGKNKYTTVGDLSSTWQTFEFEDNATPSYFYVYIYNDVADTTVYITDVEILGYYSGYSESQIAIVKDSIESSVKKGEFGSYVTQYYDRVITAFNNSSKYVQLTAGEIAIYDSSITDSKKRSAFDADGNHFYRDGYNVGMIGTNQWKDNTAHKGLVFDLEPGGKYMTFAQKANASDDSYTTMLTFSRANSIYGSYGIHLGCDLDLHGYTLKNPSFEGGGITGTLNFVQITSVNSDGTFRYASGCKLQFQNGILIGGTWNG